MSGFSEALHRNRTIIFSLTLMVILPSLLLVFLGLRAIRSENLQSQFQQRQRQQQIALFLQAELKAWLFSDQPGSAVSDALLRFTIDGDRILFPDLQFAIPPDRYANPVPFASSKNSPRAAEAGPDLEGIPNLQMIEQIYYPRIQAFLRDFKASNNSGAQYFRRLKAMIVRFHGTSKGYVLSSSKLSEYAGRKLNEMMVSENFEGKFSIDDDSEPPTSGAEVVQLKEFWFFQIAFTNKRSSGFQGSLFFYSMILLTLVAVLGVVFMYRAVTYEAAVARLRADFVSAVSHEFRTPISSMSALLERLESGHVSDSDMLRRYYGTLRQETLRLNLLIERLLDFVQFEGGKRKFSFEPLNLDDITAEAARFFQQSGLTERIEVKFSDTSPEVYVVADRTAIIQCVQNLIENALKYSAPDSRVLVTCGRQDGKPYVEVVDHGIGVPQHARERIFEKFYRADNARDLNVQGTGIGLALVKRIVEAHDASITLAPTPGKGSCFRLQFPEQEGAV